MFNSSLFNYMRQNLSYYLAIEGKDTCYHCAIKIRQVEQ